MRKLFSLVVVLLAFMASVMAQSVIKGTVVDTNGDPVIGAAIAEDGTANGTISDFNGQFTIGVTNGASLTISYVGYKTVTVKAQNGMRVVMEEDLSLIHI